MDRKTATALAIVLAVVVALTGTAAAGPQEDCIELLATQAQAIRDAGLRPSVFIAQGIHETGYCTSAAVAHNNFWGIKCRGGRCFVKDTWEEIDGERWTGPLAFQHFDTLEEGAEAYADKITRNRLYARVDRTGPLESYVASLATVWATDRRYGELIMKKIVFWGLGAYDIAPEGGEQE